MRLIDIPEIKKLSITDKILFIEELWDSIASDPSDVPVLQSHRDELERRLELYKTAPESLLSFDELRTKIKKRK